MKTLPITGYVLFRVTIDETIWVGHYPSEELALEAVKDQTAEGNAIEEDNYLALIPCCAWAPMLP